jgi:hypothetical protein
MDVERADLLEDPVRIVIREESQGFRFPVERGRGIEPEAVLDVELETAEQRPREPADPLLRCDRGVAVVEVFDLLFGKLCVGSDVVLGAEESLRAPDSPAPGRSRSRQSPSRRRIRGLAPRTRRTFSCPLRDRTGARSS